jgi:hypothetical protein
MEIKSPPIKKFARAAMLSLFVSGLAFAVPMHAYAASTDSDNDAMSSDQDNNAPVPSSGPVVTTHKMNMHPAPGMETLDERIHTLHAKLKITPDQEADFKNVADAMRSNEATIHQLIQQRHQDPDHMTAIDDLQSYQQIAQAHADGLQKLTAAFTTLYNDMSDSQKANADMVFGKYEGHRDAKAMKKSS